MSYILTTLLCYVPRPALSALNNELSVRVTDKGA